MVDSERVTVNLLDPVDPEQEAPQLARRRRRIAERLDDLDLAGVRRVLEARLDAVEGIPRGSALELQQGMVENAAATPPGRVVQQPPVPPRRRAGKKADRLAAARS